MYVVNGAMWLMLHVPLLSFCCLGTPSLLQLWPRCSHRMQLSQAPELNLLCSSFKISGSFRVHAHLCSSAFHPLSL